MKINEAAVAAWEQTLNGRPLDYILAKTEALFFRWTLSFAPVLEQYHIIEVESEFTFPLMNPETESPSRTFVEAGKIDGVLQHKLTGEFSVLEHKTTSDSIDADSDYWPRLAIDSQISKYVLALLNRGVEVRTAKYDVIRKPGQRPSQIPLLDAEGFKQVHDASGQRVKTKDGKKWRESADSAQGYVLLTREETPVEYRDRIIAEMTENPSKYFVQKEIPRLDSDLLEYMGDAWALSQQILYYRKRNLWPRNPSACTAYGTCEFFALCTGRGSVDGIQYRAKDKAHAELKIVPTTDKDFLTNSRLGALRKCARYHFHRYEEPIEPGWDTSDALAIGSEFHQAAEIFLKFFLKK